MRRVIAGFVVLVIAGGGFWFWNSRQSTASSVQYLTATASRQTVAETVAATGTVQPATTVDLAFTSSGGTSGGSSSSTVSAIDVTAGEHVVAGKVLATLTATNQQAAVSAASGQLSAAQAQVVSANAQLSSAIARRDAEPSIASQVAAARAQLATARAQLVVAEAQLAQAKAKLAGEPPGTPPAQIAADQTAIAQAQAQVVQAQGAVATAQRGVATAANGAATAASDAASIAQAQLGVTQAENGVTTARSNLTTAQTAAGATTLSAPTSGVITAVNISAGAAPPTGAAISLRSDGLVVVASVAEQDITKLKAGLTGTVTFPALGTTATATMAALPTQANSSSGGGSSTVVTFPVSLALAAPPPGLLPGMSAQISITIASSANVLAVPTTAIQGSTTAPTVEVMVNGSPQSRPVQLGLSTASTTEIVAGLTAGDVVVTGVVNPLATVTTTGGFGGGTGGLTGGGTRTGGGFGRTTG
ncbi:MAG TPA: HlyD family efflux transporter periplasmic adaptor subunit [Actinomycetes bacterium]